MQVLDVTFSIYQVYMYYNKYWCIINFSIFLKVWIMQENCIKEINTCIYVVILK